MANVARLVPETEGDKAAQARTEEVIDQATEARREALRIAEALLFAATEPLDDAQIARHLASGVDVRSVLEELREHYMTRGVNLARVAKRWYFRTAPDLGWLLSRDQQDQRKLSKAALETLAIVAYHQPVTRAEIEDIRGVTISRGTIDVLMETGWVRLRGRRKAPGRPVTYGTTENFLLHFGLENITDLPGLDELKSAGLFDGRLPKGFGVPSPSDDPELREDEDPLEGDLFDDLPLGEEGEPLPVASQSVAVHSDGAASEAVLEHEDEDEDEDEVADEAEAGQGALQSDQSVANEGEAASEEQTDAVRRRD